MRVSGSWFAACMGERRLSIYEGRPIGGRKKSHDGLPIFDEKIGFGFLFKSWATVWAA